MTRAICLWSGPRNVSTAIMYSFARNEGVRVVDEPLYGHYLRVSGAEHPGREEVIAAMNCDGDTVMQELLSLQAANPQPRLFMKHMAHHLVDMNTDFLDDTSNVLLVRDPRDMLPSLIVQLPNAAADDTGLRQQCELFDDLRARGRTPHVLDSRELLTAPGAVLQKLCKAIGLEYTDRMLQWEPGGRPEDGVWAPHWYHAVHASSGFAPYKPKNGFPDELRPLLDECLPWYEKLLEHAIRPDTTGDPP